jgi:3-hydroxyacyl-CoA dehydrogenase
MNITKAAIVGAGAMGGGIAQVISAAGLPVVLKDVDARQLELARTHLEGIYRRRVERGRMTAGEAREKIALVRYTLRYEGWGDVDIVIEAVPEDMAIKRRVLAELDEHCPLRTMFATNTSALSITELAAASGRPGKVVGLHFFNPAHVMKLVEVIPGVQTDPDVTRAALAFARRLGKIAVSVRECPGFLVNRLLMPYLNEAVVCLQEGPASALEIDAAMGRDGFGWPMGPLALMDMLGLDVCHHIIAYLATHYGDRLQEAALLRALYENGHYGQKAGQGFYAYPSNQPSPEVDVLMDGLRKGGQVAHVGSRFSADRLMALLLNEAFLCVEQGIASVGDIDVACVTGLGMQVRIGGERTPMGPLEYADRAGLDVLLERFQGLQAELGPRFRPAPILVHKVRAGNLGQATGCGFREYRLEDASDG